MKMNGLLALLFLLVLSLSFISAEIIPSSNESSNLTISCLDTDGGIDFFTKGSLINHSITGTDLSDACIPNSNYLFERHCKSSDPNNYTVITECGLGCEDGACLREPGPAPTCTDTDGGLNFYEKGAVTNEFVTGLNDSCLGNNYLFERFCDPLNKYNYTILVECENGCVNSACIEPQCEPEWFNTTNRTELECVGHNLRNVIYTTLIEDINQCPGSNSTFEVENVSEEDASCCVSDWQCEEWSNCLAVYAGNNGKGKGYGKKIDFLRTRECVDVNSCEFASEKPNEEQTCTKKDWKEDRKEEKKSKKNWKFFKKWK